MYLSVWLYRAGFNTLWEIKYIKWCFLLNVYFHSTRCYKTLGCFLWWNITQKCSSVHLNNKMLSLAIHAGYESGDVAEKLHNPWFRAVSDFPKVALGFDLRTYYKFPQEIEGKCNYNAMVYLDRLSIMTPCTSYGFFKIVIHSCVDADRPGWNLHHSRRSFETYSNLRKTTDYTK